MSVEIPIHFTFTHRGLYGLCPVYVADVDSPAPCIIPRHWSLQPLWIISEVLVAGAMILTGNYNFPITITGELKKPIVR